MKTLFSIFYLLVFSFVTFGQANEFNRTGTDCEFRLDPPVMSFSGVSSNITVNVTATAGCTWTAVSNTSWITVASGASGSGSGKVLLTTPVMVIIQRVGLISAGTVTIAGRIFTLNLQSGCAYFLSAPGAIFGNAGGVGSATVTVHSGCATSALTNDSFISITNQNISFVDELNPSTIAFTVSFTVAPNTGTAKTGIIYIAGQPFTINQAGVKSRQRVRFFL